MPPTNPRYTDDHDKLIQLETNMVALVQHIDTLVESQRNSDKKVQDHIDGLGHQTMMGTVNLIDHRVTEIADDVKEVRKAQEESKKAQEDIQATLRILRAGGAILLPIFTGCVVLVIKLFFHL